VIVNSSTNINKTNNRLKLLNIKKAIIYDTENQGLVWHLNKNVMGLKLVNEILTHSLLTMDLQPQYR